MSSSLNKVSFSGNLGREPNLSYNPSGNPYCTFSLAVSRYDFKSKKEKTMWLNIFVSGKRAETCAQWLQSGSKVIVAGELDEREWTDDNNIVRKSYSVMADDVIFIGHLRSQQYEEPEHIPAGEPDETGARF